jgi:preprotein translocase subunit SecB
MSEEQTPEAGPAAVAGDDGGAPRIRVLAQFTKDLSFENPGILKAQPGQKPPEIELGIDVRVDPGPAADKVFGVDLRLSARAMRDDQVVFICELIYSGIFQLQDF